MKVWIFLNGTQQGPFELEELLDMPVTENTKVWFEGLPKWYPAGALAEMRPLFDGTLVRGTARPEAMATPPQFHPRTEQPAPEVTVVEVEQATASVPPTAPGFTHTAPVKPCPPSYLTWGIILTICCCSPVAIGIIIASVMVGSNYARGDYKGAEKASQWAQWLIMITLALGILPILFLSIIL